MKGISRFIGLPLGMSEMSGANAPQWILQATGLAASVAGSIFGASKAAKAERARRKALARSERKEKAWYDKAYNTDYLDTKAGQNLLRRAQEIQDNYIRKADGAAAVSGGTASSSAMAKEAANRTMGNTIANIGAQDTARKQQVEDQHNQNQMNFENQKSGLAHESAMNTASAAQNMSNAMMSASSLLEDQQSKKSSASTTTPPFIEGQSEVDNSAFKQKLFNQATGIV